MTELLNADFYSYESQNWYRFVMENYVPDQSRPLVFLPCANANKTRKIYGKKKISESMTHQLLSVITKNDYFEKVIISEPLVIIPYSLEDHMPDYDYFPELLHVLPYDCVLKDDWQLKRRLAIFLYHLAEIQPNRKTLYYIGGRHHYELLKSAIDIDNKFRLVYCIPPGGIKNYSRSAQEFVKKIKKEE